ncbi:MAG: hypothetical protein JNL17_14185 [Cyclobacteriaceae bacterium]|nr:hypothetical protein [Cyclobacteriaceae bacterium]
MKKIAILALAVISITLISFGFGNSSNSTQDKSLPSTESSSGGFVVERVSR